MFDKLIDLIISLFNDFKPIVFIMQYKKGVMFRGGKYLKTLSPGWHWRLPFIDDFVMDYTMFDTMAIKEVNVTTVDGKTISVSSEFDLEVIDIYKALVLTNEWRTNLVDISRGIISNDLEDRTWEEINKKTTKNAIEKKIQKRAEEMGIEIANFNFTDKVISRAYKLFNT